MGGGTALSVNVDDSSIETNADTLRVKASGVTDAMLATDYTQVSELSSTSGGSEGSSLVGTNAKTKIGATTWTGNDASETDLETILDSLDGKGRLPSTFAAAGTPIGTQSGAYPDLYADTTNNLLYMHKNSTTANNTDWILIG